MTESRGTSGKSKKDMKESRREGTAKASSANAGKHNGDGQAADTVGQIQHQAGHLIDAAREEATGQISAQISGQRDRTANSLGILAGSLHDAGRKMREQEGGALAQYIDSAATQVDHFAEALQSQDVLQIIDSTGQFGRRQPALFMAATFALGFAGARILKGSMPSDSRPDRQADDRSWDQPSAAERAAGYSGYGGYASSSLSAAGSGYLASRPDTNMAYGSSSTMGTGASAGASRPSGTTDTMLDSEWAGSRGYDAGPEGR